MDESVRESSMNMSNSNLIKASIKKDNPLKRKATKIVQEKNK